MTESPLSGLVVGIDGGATRTRFRLADRGAGTVSGSAGPASLLGAGEDEAVADRIADEVTRLVSASGAEPPVAALCAGLAGAASRPDSVEAVRTRLADRGIAGAIRIVSDVDIAFLDAFGEAGGILIVAGTGSIARSRTTDGSLVRVGGWGALIGDEGSGYGIGLAGIRAAVRSAEDREAPTKLVDALFGALGVDSIQDLYLWSCSAAKGPVAALAPLVVEAAQSGDPVSRHIVDEAVAGLVRHAEALRGRGDLAPGVDGGEPPVALIGGLVEPGAVLHDRVVRALSRVGFRIHADEVEPVRAAVREAVRLATGP